MKPWQYPWNFPVPVRQSEFTPIEKKYLLYNVEVDTARTGPFQEFDQIFKAGELLYCDLQTNPDVTAKGHLGSGRSGFFLGKYLKGIGRTPLLQGWNSAENFEHTSGHLTASGALNEWVASCYLKAKGDARTINPCESVLLKALPKQMRGNANQSCKIDKKFHAITVKSAPFARMSNLVWMLNHLNHTNSLTMFLKLLVQFVSPPPELLLKTPATPGKW